MICSRLYHCFNMYSWLVLLFSFCQLHSAANSKALDYNEMSGNLLTYSPQSSNLDTFWLSNEIPDSTFTKLAHNPLFNENSEYDDNAKLDKEMQPQVFNEKLPIKLMAAHVNKEEYVPDRSVRSSNGARDARGDTFLRFGRSPMEDFLRLGRALPDDYMRFGRSQSDGFMRFGRSPMDNFMRFGRSPQDDYLRFGRDPGSLYLRLGRSANDLTETKRDQGNDFLRFGRSSLKGTIKNWIVADNADDLESTLMRNSRPENFLRFGRTKPIEKELAQDFIRFGRSVNSVKVSANHTANRTPNSTN